MLNRLAKISAQSVKLVNSQQRVDLTLQNVLIPRQVRKTLIETARQATTGGLVAGGLSEISARLKGDHFAINSLDSAFSVFDEQSFVVVDLQVERSVSNCMPARHTPWHRLIYAATQANYVMLCQPVYAMILAEEMRLPEDNLMLDAAQAVGGIALSTCNESEIAVSIVEHHAILVQGYGLLVWGKEANQVVSRAEIVNRWCEISFVRSPKGDEKCLK